MNHQTLKEKGKIAIENKDLFSLKWLAKELEALSQSGQVRRVFAFFELSYPHVDGVALKKVMRNLSATFHPDRLPQEAETQSVGNTIYSTLQYLQSLLTDTEKQQEFAQQARTTTSSEYDEFLHRTRSQSPAQNFADFMKSYTNFTKDFPQAEESSDSLSASIDELVRNGFKKTNSPQTMDITVSLDEYLRQDQFTVKLSPSQSVTITSKPEYHQHCETQLKGVGKMGRDIIAKLHFLSHNPNLELRENRLILTHQPTLLECLKGYCTIKLYQHTLQLNLSAENTQHTTDLTIKGKVLTVQILPAVSISLQDIFALPNECKQIWQKQLKG